MYYTVYEEIGDFKADTFPTLLEKEAENQQLIGSIIRMEQTPVKGSLMATVTDERGTLLVILNKMPPLGLCLYAPDQPKVHEALNFLAKTLYEQDVTFPDVIGESHTVEAFSLFYVAYSNLTSKVNSMLNIYELTKLQDISQAPGSLRPATAKDTFYLPYWQQSYREECKLRAASFEEIIAMFQQNIEKEMIYIWEDEIPVSMCAKGRETVNGRSVVQVYTPPHLRGQGYASSCVYALSQKLLDEGCEFVTLFADEDNPISNKIYQAMGYQYIGHAKVMSFVKGS